MVNTNWEAHWIWGGEKESPRNEWRLFRKTFDVGNQDFDDAELRITADSRYVLFVNGTRVGRGPVRSWPFELRYDTYEVGHLLKKNKLNTIAVLVLHYGVSNFYYLRGRGGLVAQLDIVKDAKRIPHVLTDDSWKTIPHPGYDTRTPRMSCQQGFVEKIDARLWEEDWTDTDYDDADWSQAEVIGKVGMEPWKKLVPRDIPLLTEEPVYPKRVKTLAFTKSFDWSAALDIRNHMVPDSVNHANHVSFVAVVATLIRMEEAGNVTLGFVQEFGDIYVDGVRYTREHFTGESPERYLEVFLEKGDHLVLLDVSGGTHGDPFGIGIASDAPFTVQSPINDASPFISIGPFDSKKDVDHKPGRELNFDHPVYQEICSQGIKNISELEKYKEWIQPFALQLVSQEDPFTLSVWKKEYNRQPIPYSLQAAIIAHGNAGEVPVKEGYDTEFIVDFGKEWSGFLEFEVAAAPGTIIDFYGFEYMKDDYIQHTFRLNNTLRYITKEGRQVYSSAVRRGLRYVMLTVRNATRPVKFYNFRLLQSNYPIAEIGYFHSSDAKLNAIWEISKHTTRLCLEDTFVDCPAYEQVYWVGDSRNEALIHNYLFGDRRVVERCLRLVPPSKVQTPLYVNQVPSGWNSVIPNWTFFWVIACFEHYERTGDLDFLKEMRPHIKYTTDHYLEYINEDGLFDIKAWNLLDWATIEQPNQGVVSHQNFFLMKVLRVNAEIAKLTGYEDDEKYYLDKAEQLKNAINNHLWNDEKQAYHDCIYPDGRKSKGFSMQTQVVAYLTDGATEERIARLEELIKNPPQDFVQIGSPFMSFFFYEVLEKLEDYELMLEDIRKNYGQMIDHGATTCWEMYPQSIFKANPKMLTRSHCHAWSSAPAYFFGRVLLGVKSLESGWKKVLVQPQPCGLDWANGSVPLPNEGQIDVEWKLLDTKKMWIQVTYPQSVNVDIQLPEGYTGDIKRITY